MKILRIIVIAVATSTILRAHAQLDTSALQLVPPDQLPKPGTYWHASDQADMWLNGTLANLYFQLYGSASLTQYSPGLVGTNRNHGDAYPRNAFLGNWQWILSHLTNANLYSDLTLGPAHGSGAEIGGGTYLTDSFAPPDLGIYVRSGSTGKDWRLRKAALWTCYSGDIGLATGGFYISSWPSVCGIRPGQNSSYMRKNCGLFFQGEIPQRGFGGNWLTTTATCVEFCDQTWVCGKFQFPGGCDPTYSFRFAVAATIRQYPELVSIGNAKTGQPAIFGYPMLIYSSIYDDELMMLDTTHVKDR